MKTLLALCFTLVLLGCSVTGGIKETQPLQQSLNSYKNLRVEVLPSKPEWKDFDKSLEENLVVMARTRGVFATVNPRSADRAPASADTLLLKARVIDFEQAGGNFLSRMASDSKVTMEGRLFAGDRELVKFIGEGNSKDTSQTSVGGVNITKMSRIGADLNTKAIRVLAEHVAKYIEEKHKQ